MVVTVYKCRNDWLFEGRNGNILYPLLYHRTVDVVDDDKRFRNNDLVRDILNARRCIDLRLGGSYNIFSYLPLHSIRVAWFENNLLPYAISTPVFRVVNGIFLWDRFNMSLYTDLVEPTRVFVKKDDKFIGKIEFKDNIYITELNFERDE